MWRVLATLATLATALAIAACCRSDEGKPAGEDAGPVVPAAPPPRVSKPGATAIDALKKVKEPRALLFVPPGPVADQLMGYMTDLGRKADVPFEVREMDRLLQAEEAKRFRVVRDGVLVLVSGDDFQSVEVHDSATEAEADLARLDSRVARALTLLGRGRRQVALVKHQVADVARFLVFEQALAALHFEVVTVAPGAAVPAGAVAIFLDVGAGPTRPAMESIDRHLAAGGAALIAIEPRKGAALGPLEARLGLALAEGVLLDPAAHAVLRKDRSDLGLVVTNRLTAHASLAGLGRMPVGGGLLFAQGGALVERGEPPAGTTRIATIRSMPTAFLDVDGNHARGGREQATSHIIAAAVSGPARAIVIADASWLSDEVLRSVPAEAALLTDALRWLAGEEVLSGEVIDEPATGERLTSYPLRTVPGGVAARGALWKAAPEGVHGLRFTSRGRVVILERKDGALWGRVERPGPDGAAQVREFPLGELGEALFAALASPTPLRTVGPLDATTRARYGLDDGTLVVDVSGGATHTLLVGARVMGSNDRYASDPAARAVVILPASLIEPLDQPDRLALRKAIDLDPKALTRLVVSRGDKNREAVREVGGGWKVAGGGSDEAYLAEEIARAAFLLVPLDFARADKASALTPRGKVTFSAGSAPSVELEIYAGTGDEFWIATRLTRGMARVSAGSARRIAEAIDQLLADPGD